MEKPEVKEVPQPKLRAVLTIKLYEDGQMQVDGPLSDPLLYRGMLGLAEDLGREYSAAAMKQMAQQTAPPKKGSLGFWQRKVAEFKQRTAEKRAREEAAKQNQIAASAAPAPDQGGTPSQETK